jgi:hypothetical protein
VPTPIQEAQWVLRAQCDDRDALEQLLRSVQHSVHVALARVDRSKYFILTAIALLFVAILFTFGFLAAHARSDADGHSKLLFGATVAQMAFIGICAVLVSFHVSRMTKTVLNAIELATRK